MESTLVETVVATIDNTHIMNQALVITLIGMGLLFVSLFILWGVMEILVRLVKDPVADEDEAPEELEIIDVVDEDVLKMRAAAAAVASIQNYDLKMRAAAAAAGYVHAKNN